MHTHRHIISHRIVYLNGCFFSHFDSISVRSFFLSLYELLVFVKTKRIEFDRAPIDIYVPPECFDRLLTLFIQFVENAACERAREITRKNKWKRDFNQTECKNIPSITIHWIAHIRILNWPEYQEFFNINKAKHAKQKRNKKMTT